METAGEIILEIREKLTRWPWPTISRGTLGHVLNGLLFAQQKGAGNGR